MCTSALSDQMGHWSLRTLKGDADQDRSEGRAERALHYLPIRRGHGIKRVVRLKSEPRRVVPANGHLTLF